MIILRTQRNGNNQIQNSRLKNFDLKLNIEDQQIFGGVVWNLFSGAT